MNPPAGSRRTDHRAYAIRCPYEGCNAGPWRACVGCGGAEMDEPHPERVEAERGARGGKGMTAEQRTPELPFLNVTDNRNERWKEAERRAGEALRSGEDIAPADLAIINEEQAAFDASIEPDLSVDDRAGLRGFREDEP